MKGDSSKRKTISEEMLARYRAAWLWDFLYPNIPEFVRAMRSGEVRAIARLVEVNGLIIARKILGEIVLDQFHQYKKYIPPVRKRELETLWEILYQMKK